MHVIAFIILLYVQYERQCEKVVNFSIIEYSGEHFVL